MAYRTLYRAYRPQNFQEVAGQEHITQTLQNAIKENRIAHAYLFTGPRGTGKTSIAKIFAKAINCENDNKPCNNCENCKMITIGDHPDIIEIDAASNNGVEEARDLIEKVKYAPMKAKYKVYIIDEVHMMTQAAFNALLKTLEEPPAHVVFILATTEPQKIIPTIISRCQRFDFKKVDNNDIINRMIYVLNQEGFTYDISALKTIAKLANGGMRDALSILEQVLAYDTNLNLANVNKIYGIYSTEKIIAFIKLIISKNVQEVLNTFNNLVENSIDLKILSFDIIDILKDIIIYKNTKNDQILFKITKEDIDNISPYILIEEAFNLIDILLEAIGNYGKGINDKVYFELALLKMISKKDENIEKKEIIEETKEIENKQEVIINEEIKEIINEEVEEIVEEEIEINSHIEISNDDIMNILVQAKKVILNDIKDHWSLIRRYCHNLNTAKYANMVCEGIPVAASENAFILAFSYQAEANLVNYNETYFELKKFIKDILGTDYDFIALTNDQWTNIREEYINLYRNNQLPEAKPITLSHIKEIVVEKQLTEAQEFGLNLFGSDFVEIEE